MGKDNKYKQVLWLNNDLIIDETNIYYRLLNSLRKEAEDKYKDDLSIQTCVTADDFLSLANDETLQWDVFIFDAKVGEKDVFGDVLGKTDTTVQRNGILLYCLTRFDIDSSVKQLMTDYNFSKSQQGGLYYSYSDNTKMSDIPIFDDVFNKLKEKGKLFQPYPEIEEIYDEIKRSHGSGNEATKAIINMLQWRADSHSVSGFEEGIRTVLKRVGDNLCNLGFFNIGNRNNKLKSPGDSGFNSISGFYINIMERDPDTDEYLYSDDCRLKWEASAMYFLGSFADIVHHDLQKVQGNNEDYNEYYRDMVFRAFVLYSKWYSRFKTLCSNASNNNWMFNPLYGVHDLPLEIGKQYANGELDYITDKKGNSFWVVKLNKYKIAGSRSWRVDYNVPNKSSFQRGAIVSFEISSNKRAINIVP